MADVGNCSSPADDSVHGQETVDVRRHRRPARPWSTDINAGGGFRVASKATRTPGRLGEPQVSVGQAGHFAVTPAGGSKIRSAAQGRARQDDHDGSRSRCPPGPAWSNRQKKSARCGSAGAGSSPNDAGAASSVVRYTLRLR